MGSVCLQFLPTDPFHPPLPFYSPMGRRLTPSAISSLASQILRSLQSPSPPLCHRLPPLPLPLSTPLILSVLRSSPSPLLSLRFYLHAFSLPSPLSPHCLSLFSSYLLPSLPLLLSPSLPAFPPTLSSFRALFSICIHPTSPPPPWLPSFAHNLLDLMQSDFNCKPDTFCYNTVIRIYTQQDQAEKALSLYQEMCKKHILPNMATSVILVKGLARMGKVEAARAVIDDMGLFGCTPNTVVYTSFLDGLCDSGKLEMAMEVLAEMEHELGTECEPNVVTYTCLLKCLCDNGRIEDVLRMLERMGKRGIRPNRVTVQTILKGFCIDEHSDKIQGLIDSLVGEKGVSIRECYSLIVTCFSKAGRVDEAKILIMQMLENGIEMDALAINSLLRELCAKKHFLDAYYWWQDNGYDSVDSDVYSCLLAGLCKESLIKEAVDLARKVVERSIRIENRFVDRIVEGLKSLGEFDLANGIDNLKEIDIIQVQDS